MNLNHTCNICDSEISESNEVKTDAADWRDPEVYFFHQSCLHEFTTTPHVRISGSLYAKIKDLGIVDARAVPVKILFKGATPTGRLKLTVSEDNATRDAFTDGELGVMADALATWEVFLRNIVSTCATSIGWDPETLQQALVDLEAIHSAWIKEPKLCSPMEEN